VAYLDQVSNPRKALNHQIAKDVLTHLNSIVENSSLRKLDRRSGVNQALYAVAKRFGHRSDHPDLYLWHSSEGPDPLFFEGDECIRASNVAKVGLYYRLWLLGKQTKSTYSTNQLKASAAPNEICIYILGGGRLGWRVNVTVDLSGPALLQFCADNGQFTLARRLRALIQAKWGSVGVAFGNVDSSERAGQQLAPIENDWGEAYKYRRYVNSMLTNYEDGIGWII
jgi:hypothetical protein